MTSKYSTYPRRLYLDDVRPCPVGWYPCRTPSDFKFLVQNYQWDEMSLDHDLGDHPDLNPDMITGYDLLQWMCSMGWAMWPEHKPRVHSFNPVGAENMRTLIEHYWNQKTR